MTTDTPRTDAATELYGERPFMTPAVPVEFAQQLERELKASQAEVERLKALVNQSIVEKSNLSITLVNCQADLRRAIEIAEELSSGDAWKFTAADEKLVVLKGEIK